MPIGLYLVWYNHPLHKEEESGDSRIVQLVIHCRISAVTALNRMKPYSSALSKHVVVNEFNSTLLGCDNVT